MDGVGLLLAECSGTKTYPPVFLYYPKSAGKTKRVQSLIEFLILKNTR